MCGARKNSQTLIFLTVLSYCLCKKGRRFLPPSYMKYTIVSSTFPKRTTLWRKEKKVKAGSDSWWRNKSNPETSLITQTLPNTRLQLDLRLNAIRGWEKRGWFAKFESNSFTVFSSCTKFMLFLYQQTQHIPFIFKINKGSN